MKFTLSWLKKFLDTEASIEQICETLTALGIEVESISDKSKELAPFIIAEIIETKQHPNADKLKLCTVITGKEIVKIVCGAVNARSGIKVVLAEIGTVIPSNGMLIKQSKIRGENSYGMLCSAEELGLNEKGDGIIELSPEAVVGQKFIQFRQELADPVIDVAITSNRADCFGIYGIARDLAAANIGKLKPLQVLANPTNYLASPIKVKVENSEDCPIFVARYFWNIKNCESPAWLKNLLKSIGEESISALVDITNYICYSFSRPLHVFDAKKIHGSLNVRKAKHGEKLEALNGKTYLFDGTEIIVADDKGPLAIGGIMGGNDSGCSMQTREVLLEAAIFDAKTIATTGRKHAIESDARQRFERGLDPEFVVIGIDIATNLIIEICGGSCSDLVVVGLTKQKIKKVMFHLNRVELLSGVKIKPDVAQGILHNLGFSLEDKTEYLEVQVPSWRHDINIPEDLVEEILRVYGYDKIKALKLPLSSFTREIFTCKQKLLSQTRRMLVENGLNDTITWSFMSSKNAESFTTIIKQMQITNPISHDLDYMRASMIPNLLEAIQKNYNRSLQSSAFFEIGPVFSWVNDRYHQNDVITGTRFGAVNEKNWFKDSRSIDVFDAKADLCRVLTIFGVNIDECSLNIENFPTYYHPTRSASFNFKGKVVGYFGEIHPLILQKYDFPSAVVAFECLIENIDINQTSARQSSSDFQPVNRDFAFVVEESVLAGSMIKAITKLDQLIKEVRVFDVYKGEGVESGKKSVAISVRLQAQDHTLTNEEIQSISDKIIDLIKLKVGGELRI